jgi:N,N'-diacetyllegionaminate synthase
MPKRTFIIAEAGVNHNGDIELARRLVDIAKEAGADAVKFQTFIAEQVVSAYAEKAEYQKTNTGNNESQLEMIKKLELSFADFEGLQAYCKKAGILFLSTAFDLDSISFLSSLQLPYGKVPSGEITNLPYLEKMAGAFPKIILSTGMASYEEIGDALAVLKAKGVRKEDITVLHCNTEYPTPLHDVNLVAMLEIKKRFDVAVGYSDHTLGIGVPVAATALGATIIEKHFTTDTTLPGPDHVASLDPIALKEMVKAIREVDTMLGDPSQKPTQSETKNKPIARRSIVAKKKISKGETFTENNISVKRPGTGISPMKWYDVLGKVAARDFEPDQLIEL